MYMQNSIIWATSVNKIYNHIQLITFHESVHYVQDRRTQIECGADQMTQMTYFSGVRGMLTLI